MLISVKRWVHEYGVLTLVLLSMVLSYKLFYWIILVLYTKGFYGPLCSQLVYPILTDAFNLRRNLSLVTDRLEFVRFLGTNDPQNSMTVERIIPLQLIFPKLKFSAVVLPLEPMGTRPLDSVASLTTSRPKRLKLVGKAGNKRWPVITAATLFQQPAQNEGLDRKVGLGT